MFYSIIDYIEDMAERFPNRIVYCDNYKKISFKELRSNTQKISVLLHKLLNPRQPVIVFMDKGVDEINAMLGILRYGGYYIPIDRKMPIDRIELIISQLNAKVVIADKHTIDISNSIFKQCHIINYDNWLKNIVDESDSPIDICSIDIAYVLFTSGSTGTPKGVSITHGALIDFIEWICDKYKFDCNIKLCNQAPFYFDASVPDIYIPLKTGGCCFVPPQSSYKFPAKILNYISHNNINTLVWVPSALINVIKFGALDVCQPKSIERIIFCGEVFPVKYLKAWKERYPNVKFTNMYGPTEATYACTYYDIPDDFDGQDIPLGYACSNCRILLLNESNIEITNDNEVGEICIQGVCLSSGYYGNNNAANRAFVQNPQHDAYRDLIYKTGDLAYISDGIIYYKGRRDGQIKINGYRVELSEIESVIMTLENIEECCCFFAEGKIYAVYCGEVNEAIVRENIVLKLPKYMIPGKLIRIGDMPHNINGKMDRIAIRERYVKEEY